MSRTPAATLGSVALYPELPSFIFQVVCSSSMQAFMLSTSPDPPGQKEKAWDWISGRTSPPIESVIHLFSAPWSIAR